MTTYNVILRGQSNADYFATNLITSGAGAGMTGLQYMQTILLSILGSQAQVNLVFGVANTGQTYNLSGYTIADGTGLDDKGNVSYWGEYHPSDNTWTGTVPETSMLTALTNAGLSGKAAILYLWGETD